MDLDGNIVRVLEVRLLDKDDGTDVLGVLQQATTRFNLVCVHRTGTGVMIIDPAARLLLSNTISWLSNVK
jgi:hypothetical protein